MFHLISFSLHFIDHVSFFSFNLIVSFTFQLIPFLEIKNLRVPLRKFLILDRYSLLEAELRWFYYSLPLYIKQEIQQIVSFDVGMGPDPPVSYSQSQVALKFLMTKALFPGALS